jgi:ubiquinone/menaquinone biosynthesis C-methylase UbiE
MMSTLQERIEILPVSLLDTQRARVEEIRRLSRELAISLGWHYLLDLSWAMAALDPAKGMRVIDAGAGTGIMQWWLAEHGINVISLDRNSRYRLPLRFRRRFRVEGLRREDLAPRRGLLFSFSLREMAVSWLELLRKRQKSPEAGTVFIYNRDLADMPDLPSGSVDAIVAISALEHNSPEGLRVCVAELMRVLKPGGVLAATLGAAKDEDWFHEPSQGWCYTEATLRDIFSLPAEAPSNYDHYDELFAAVRNCAELRDNLARFYFGSGNNGMPWGKWDPQYMPVGVVKVKNKAL